MYRPTLVFILAHTSKHSEEVNIIGCWLMRSIDECEPNLRLSEHTRFCLCNRIGPLKWLGIPDDDIPTFRVYIAFFGRPEYTIL